jgi:hypothetical protein
MGAFEAHTAASPGSEARVFFVWRNVGPKGPTTYALAMAWVQKAAASCCTPKRAQALAVAARS